MSLREKNVCNILHLKKNEWQGIVTEAGIQESLDSLLKAMNHWHDCSRSNSGHPSVSQTHHNILICTAATHALGNTFFLLCSTHALCSKDRIFFPAFLKKQQRSVSPVRFESSTC